MHISVYLFIFAEEIIAITPKSRKGKTDMKKYIVMYAPTSGAQPPLQSLTKKTPEYVYEFETTDLEEALEVAKKEVGISDLTTVKELTYSPTDEEFYKTTTRIEILETDDDGELIGWVEFDSPTYWLGEK